MSKKLVIGYDTNNVTDIKNLLNSTEQDGFDFVCIPIFHPRYERSWHSDARPVIERSDPPTRSDLLLPTSDWTNLVVGKLSPWIELDSPQESIRKNSEKVTLSLSFLLTRSF